ncbi:MAG: hypothetical protein HC933_18725, partial [Pleurocapsa sp. SU_196_0]|nr:hypothetical protein [Pleurocapsa sp. SU_196_0]
MMMRAPATAQTFNLTATASSELSGTLVLGTGFNLALARPGRTARLTFVGVAGQVLGLAATATTFTGTASALVNVVKPDGAVLATTTWNTGANALTLPPLPVGGTYAVVVEPQDTATLSTTVTVSVPNTFNATVDAAPTNFNNTTAGQIINISFSGTSGQSLGFGINNLSSTMTASDAITARLYSPSNALITQAQIRQSDLTLGGSTFFARNLAATGTYRLELTPPATTTISAGLLTMSTEQVLTTPALGTPLDVPACASGRDCASVCPSRAANSTPCTSELAGGAALRGPQ